MNDPGGTTFSPEYERAMEYFRSLTDYSPSPIRFLTRSDGLEFILKDETNRMGLGAFKALGGPYAVVRLICENWQEETGEALPVKCLDDAKVRQFAKTQTFVCASAGNHGLGVAKGAANCGARARIYLSATVPGNFEDRLRDLGAEVVRAGSNYDESVAAAIDDTEQSGAILLADGTWDGYTRIPKLVMEGYTVIAEELRHSFQKSGDWPSHVYLQAGVGGLACAMAYMIRLNWSVQPALIVVEPEAAPCLKASHDAARPVRAEGPDSNMGRLDCKEPSIVAFDVLERCGVSYMTVSDNEALAATRALEKLGVITTPSGAAGFSGLCKQFPNARDARQVVPLVIASEGR
jgi:diaminopropionate ammonia-lyase